MAIVIVQIDDRFAAGVFHTRALIGRKPFNGIQLEHRTVSRIHAWIDKVEEGFRLTNASTRNGTFVNGQPLTSSVILRDGDHIQVGLAKLMFRENDDIPEGAVTFEISEKGTNPSFDDEGILFHCQCGAPLWVPSSMAGAFGKCAHCKGDIVIPGAPLTGIRRPLSPNESIADMPAIREPLGSTTPIDDPLAAVHEPVEMKPARKPFTASPRPKAGAARQICSVCQAAIEALDPVTTCTACSQTYHSECWLDNHGCAAYGCSQVGILDSQPSAAVTEAEKIELAPAPGSDATFPWEFALLGGSVLGSVVGAFTFGVPALAVGSASAVFAMRRTGGRARVAMLSTVICFIGVALGIMTSRSWWFDAPLWKWGR